MRRIQGIIGVEAWVLLGDFNAARSVTEKRGMEGFPAAAEFNSCIGDIGVEDLNQL